MYMILNLYKSNEQDSHVIVAFHLLAMPFHIPLMSVAINEALCVSQTLSDYNNNHYTLHYNTIHVLYNSCVIFCLTENRTKAIKKAAKKKSKQS